jgi:hypothetical protein
MALPHECIHLLSPTGRASTNVLEEGIATWFARTFSRDAGFGDISPIQSRYIEAEKLAGDLLVADPAIVKRVRGTKPTISQIAREDLLWANPNIDGALAEALTRPF